MGRRRYFFGRWGDDLVREALAFIPQSTIGDYLNLGLLRLWRLLKKKPIGEVLMQVHDEIVGQVGKGKEEELKEMLAEAFNIELKVGKYFFKIPWEVKFGANWDEAKP